MSLHPLFGVAPRSWLETILRGTERDLGKTRTQLFITAPKPQMRSTLVFHDGDRFMSFLSAHGDQDIFAQVKHTTFYSTDASGGGVGVWDVEWNIDPTTFQFRRGNLSLIGFADATLVFDNDTEIAMRNVANTSHLDVLKLDTNDDLIIGGNIVSGKVISIGGQNGVRLLFKEQTTDANAPTNKSYMWIEDNAGKTQLVIRFQSGAKQVIAVEP